MFSFFKDYFQYSRAERNGVIALLLLCFLVFLLPQIYPWFHKEKAVDFEEWDRLTAAWQADTISNAPTLRQAADSLFYFDPNTISPNDLRRLGLSKKVANTIENYRSKGGRFFKKEDLKKIYGLPDTTYHRLEGYILFEAANSPPPQVEQSSFSPPIEYFPFNPNTASIADLKRLGLGERVVRTLDKFRSKGGRFYKKESLSKIYGLSKRDYERLLPWIRLDDEEPDHTGSQQVALKARPESVSSRPAAPIDINAADVETWQSLRGIGPYFAQRIVKFRDALGGFYELQQVADTYQLPDSTYQAIRPFLKLSPIFRTLKINSATVDELARHPYLNRKQAGMIVNYRKQHGPFGGKADLRNLRGIPSEQLDKLTHYVAY